MEGERPEILYELAGCALCGAPVAAPDQRTLYFVRSDVTGRSYASRVIRIDVGTGQGKEGPVFYTGPHPWFASLRAVSRDGRQLYMEIPYNPADSSVHPLHGQRGFATYDLEEQRLLERPFLAMGPGDVTSELHLSADGTHGYLCCWVQGADHPHPGITTVDLASGEAAGRVMLKSPAQWVHPTRLTPAGDGRHFFALRAGSDQWWEIDARESKITRMLPVAAVPPSLPETARGSYLSAAGSLVAAPGPGLLFSSLYLVEQSRMEPGPPKYMEGGGILALRTRDFTEAAHLLPDRTFEALAVSPDGARLYALDAEAGEILVFDTGSLKQLANIKDLGRRPTQLLTLRR